MCLDLLSLYFLGEGRYNVKLGWFVIGVFDGNCKGIL